MALLPLPPSEPHEQPRDDEAVSLITLNSTDQILDFLPAVLLLFLEKVLEGLDENPSSGSPLVVPHGKRPRPRHNDFR
jgi:hypothetical protein